MKSHTHAVIVNSSCMFQQTKYIQSIFLFFVSRFVFVLDWNTKHRIEKKKLTINRRMISEWMKLFLFFIFRCFELERCVNFHIKATPIWVVAFRKKKVSRKKRKYFTKKNTFRDVNFYFGSIIKRPNDDVPISMFFWRCYYLLPMRDKWHLDLYWFCILLLSYVQR